MSHLNHCKVCRIALSPIEVSMGIQCNLCAVKSAIKHGNRARAYQIAVARGYTVSEVRSMCRSAMRSDTKILLG